MLKAVVLDFDGVMVDSEPLHYRAFGRMVQQWGLDLSWSDYVEKYIGYDDRDLFRAFLADSGRLELLDGDDMLEQWTLQKGDVFETIIQEGVTPTPGLAAFIEHTAAELPLAIASGASQRDIDLILAELGWRERFDVIVSADDVHRSKPDPATYRQACERLAQAHPALALQPGDCLAIEDTPAGLASAQAAGLMTLGLTHWSNPTAVTQAQRSTKTFETLTLLQLHEWFD